MKLDIIYNEDCIGEKGMRILPDASIDMILADVPYGRTACKWDTIIPLEPMWEQLKRVIKPSGAIVMTASQPFTTTLIASNMKMFKYCWYWIKDKPSNFMMGKKQPLRYVEECVLFSKGSSVYNPVMQLREEKNKRNNKLTSSFLRNENIGINVKTDKYQDRLKSGMNDYIYPRNYQFFNNRTNGLHPTQKPVALMEYLIKTYTNEGEILLDFAFGSGTTLVACRQLGRHYIGFEINPEYCKIAKKRLAQVQLELGIR